jgi:hypothetical protein
MAAVYELTLNNPQRRAFRLEVSFPQVFYWSISNKKVFIIPKRILSHLTQCFLFFSNSFAPSFVIISLKQQL